MGEKERPNLLKHFSSTMRAEIEQKGLREVVIFYGKALRTVRRQGHTDYLPRKPRYKETLYDHVAAMLDDWNIDIKINYPHMAIELPSRPVEIRAGTHDAGEIVVGDAPGIGPLRYTDRWIKAKENEAAAAINEVFVKIEDQSVRDEICGNYLRYEEKNPHDRITQFVNTLDKAQGNRTMLRDRLNPKQFGMQHPTDKMYAHAEESAAKFYNVAVTFYNSLRTPEGKRDAVKWISREFDQFRLNGYGNVAWRHKLHFLHETYVADQSKIKQISTNSLIQQDLKVA